MLIESLESDQFKTKIAATILRENPLNFAFNKHATHVLIKFIENTTEDPFLNELYEVLTCNITELSKDSNGLPLVKKLLTWIRTPNLKANMNR